MLNTEKKIKDKYHEIQKQIFCMIPEKWEEFYLYASIVEGIGNIQLGEMYFYYMPKGIIKKKFINGYEIPDRFNIEEDEYAQVIDELYNLIKELRNLFLESNDRVWTNLTISIKNSRFKIEFNHDLLKGGKEEYFNHHIYWRKKYLNIDPQGIKERKAINDYMKSIEVSHKRNDSYDEGMYEKQKLNSKNEGSN